MSAARPTLGSVSIAWSRKNACLMRHDCHKDREALWSYRGGQDALSVSERIKGITSVAGQVDAKTVDPGQLTFGKGDVPLAL